MVTRLRAILSTLRPSCLHNQPYRWGARCGPVAWSCGAAVRLTESKLALAARSDLPRLCSSVLCCRHRDAAPPPLLFLAGPSVGELDAGSSEICSLSSRCFRWFSGDCGFCERETFFGKRRVELEPSLAGGSMHDARKQGLIDFGRFTFLHRFAQGKYTVCAIIIF